MDVTLEQSLRMSTYLHGYLMEPKPYWLTGDTITAFINMAAIGKHTDTVLLCCSTDHLSHHLLMETRSSSQSTAGNQEQNRANYNEQLYFTLDKILIKL